MGYSERKVTCYGNIGYIRQPVDNSYCSYDEKPPTTQPSIVECSTFFFCVCVLVKLCHPPHLKQLHVWGKFPFPSTCVLGKFCTLNPKKLL